MSMSEETLRDLRWLAQVNSEVGIWALREALKEIDRLRGEIEKFKALDASPVTGES